MSKFNAGLRPFTQRGLLTLLAAALLAGCGARGDRDYPVDEDDDDFPPGYVRLDLGGGEYVLPGNRGYVRIPPGAVAAPAGIRITEIDLTQRPEYAGADVAFDIEHTGAVLTKPAQIEVLLEPKPRQPDGSYSVGAGAIVLSRGGNNSAAALADQRLWVDATTNTSRAIGTLPSLESFAFTSRLKTDTGTSYGSLNATLRPLPDKLTVDVGYRVEFAASSDGFAATDTISGEFSYKDSSDSRLRHAPDAGNTFDAGGYYRLNTPPLPGIGRITLGGAEYRPESAADKVDSNLELKLDNTNLRLDVGGAALRLPQLRFQFMQSHQAESATTPPPQSPPGDGAYRVINVRRGGEQLVALDGWQDFRQKLELPSGEYVAFATSNPGVHIIDLAGGETVRSQELAGSPMFGVVPHMKDGAACLFGYGATTARTCYATEFKDFGPTEIGIGVGPVTDADLLSTTPVTTPTGLRHLLWFVGNGGVVQEYQPDGAGTEVRQRGLADRGAMGWYRNGGTATGKPQSAFFNANGDRVLVARGEANAPGQLWWGNPGDPAGGMFVGSLGANGNDTRKIRCVLPVCAVSSFGGLVSIVLWDGVNVPAIVGTIAGTSGAVGIDVATEGANRVIRNADFNANTVTKTVVDGAGNIVSSVTKAVPPGCLKPGHVTAQADANNQARTYVSCNSSSVQDKSALAILNDRLYFGQ